MELLPKRKLQQPEHLEYFDHVHKGVLQMSSMDLKMKYCPIAKCIPNIDGKLREGQCVPETY